MTETVVLAGGGIVWGRDEGGGVEIVLVHRPADDDWSFPKGKLDRDEPQAQAALREVPEETGLVCRLGPEIGTTSYRGPKRRPKTVRYWEMTPTTGTLAAANEIDDARWGPLQQAPRLLSYAHDRRLLDSWQPPRERPGSSQLEPTTCSQRPDQAGGPSSAPQCSWARGWDELPGRSALRGR